MPATEPIIEFAKVNKWYGQFHVLRDIDLNVAKGERIVICGPSGSGKSTLIRCINRLEEHQQGTLKVDGVELTDDVKAIEAIRKAGRDGVPAVQPVPAPDRAAEPDARADVGRQGAEEGGGRAGDAAAEARQDRRAGGEVSAAALGRAAAARGDRARAVPHAEDHAVRRADLGARPRDDQGGAGRDDRAREHGHHDAVRDARDGLCANRSPTA